MKPLRPVPILLVVLTAASAQAPPAPGLDPTPLAAEALGLTMSLPAGAIVSTQSSDQAISYLVTDAEGTWSLRVSNLSPAVPDPTAEALAGELEAVGAFLTQAETAGADGQLQLPAEQNIEDPARHAGRRTSAGSIRLCRRGVASLPVLDHHHLHSVGHAMRTQSKPGASTWAGVGNGYKLRKTGGLTAEGPAAWCRQVRSQATTVRVP